MGLIIITLREDVVANDNNSIESFGEGGAKNSIIRGGQPHTHVSREDDDDSSLFMATGNSCNNV